MKLLKVGKDIFETINVEISDEEAMELVADWGASLLLVFEFEAPKKDWNTSTKPRIEIFQNHSIK